MKTKAFYLFALCVLSQGCWLSACFPLSRLGPDWLGALPIVAWLFVSALALAATRLSHSAWIHGGLLILAVSSLLPFALVSILPDRPWLPFALLTPPVAVLITLLLYSGLNSDRAWQNVVAAEDGGSQTQRRQAIRAAVVLVLSALTLVCWRFAGFLFGFSPFLSGPLGWLTVLVIVLLLVPALALAARKVSHNVWGLAALPVLASLFLPASLFVKLPGPLGEPLSTSQAMMLLAILSTALVTAALLLRSGLNLLKNRHNTGALEGEGSQAQRRHVGRTASFVLALGSLLLVKALYDLYWFMVWDTTTDPLGYFWLVVPVVAVLLSGVTLSITLSGRTRWAGLLYSLLIPALMIAVSARAQSVDFRQLTKERAGRVSQAIETYFAREGRYPQDPRQLIPRYVLSLSGPVIIYGQSWCYDGGDDYYRLGYVFREHWSDPLLTGRIYEEQGEVPDLPGVCDEEIAALEERYPLFRERR